MELVSYDDINDKYDPKKNTTCALLTKYEFTIIVGQRMEQLARGAPSFFDGDNDDSTNYDKPAHEQYREIVQKEIDMRVCPMMIERTLPNGSHEYWKLKDMIIPKFE